MSQGVYDSLDSQATSSKVGGVCDLPALASTTPPPGAPNHVVDKVGHCMGRDKSLTWRHSNPSRHDLCIIQESLSIGVCVDSGSCRPVPNVDHPRHLGIASSQAKSHSEAVSHISSESIIRPTNDSAVRYAAEGSSAVTAWMSEGSDASKIGIIPQESLIETTAGARVELGNSSPQIHPDRRAALHERPNPM
jgi:hypothetical protein